MRSGLSVESQCGQSGSSLDIVPRRVERFLAFLLAFPRGEQLPRWDPHWEWFDAQAGKGKQGGYIFPEWIVKVLDHVVY